MITLKQLQDAARISSSTEEMAANLGVSNRSVINRQLRKYGYRFVRGKGKLIKRNESCES